MRAEWGRRSIHREDLMGRYVLRRLLQLIPVFFGTTFLIYMLVYYVPGDPFAGKCGERACPPAYVQYLTEKFHLDKPLIVQYLTYMKNVFQGDFGTTYNNRPISEIIANAYPNTLKLALVGVGFEILIGLVA